MISGLKVIKIGNDCVTLHCALVKRYPRYCSFGDDIF